MPLCISCGESIPEGKRKHAVYCDSKCRGRQYRKRHPKSALTDGSGQQRTSTVLECPCGRRYLLSVTELHAHDAEAVTTTRPASVTQTDPNTDPNTDSNTEKKWTERCHADDQSVAQTVLEAVSPNVTQDRQAEQQPQADTQTVSATTAHASDDGNNRDRDRIIWEHIEKLLPKVLSDFVSQNNVTPGNKTTHQR